MRKICLLIIALVCVSGFSILLMAEGPDKLDQLKKKRADILTQMNNRRMKLIEEDLKLKEIHDKIMALHKELAIKLDSDSEISKFANQIRDIDSDIDSLSEKSKKDEGKEENKVKQITQ